MKFLFLNFFFSIFYYYYNFKKIKIFFVNNYSSINSKINNLKFIVNKNYISYATLLKKNSILEKWKKNNSLNYHLFINLFLNKWSYLLNSVNFFNFLYLKKNFFQLINNIKKKISKSIIFIIFFFKKNSSHNNKKMSRIKKKFKKKKWIYF